MEILRIDHSEGDRWTEVRVFPLDAVIYRHAVRLHRPVSLMFRLDVVGSLYARGRGSKR